MVFSFSFKRDVLVKYTYRKELREKSIVVLGLDEDWD